MGKAYAADMGGEPIVEQPVAKSDDMFSTKTNYEHYKDKVLGGLAKGVKGAASLYQYHPYQWNIYDAVEDIPKAVEWLRKPHAPDANQTPVGEQEPVNKEALLDAFGGTEPQRQAKNSAALGVSRPKGGSFISQDQLTEIENAHKTTVKEIETTANTAVTTGDTDIFWNKYNTDHSSGDNKKRLDEKEKVIMETMQAQIKASAELHDKNIKETTDSYKASLGIVRDSIGNLGKEFKTADRDFMSIQLNDVIQNFYGPKVLSNPSNNGMISQHVNAAAGMVYNSGGEISHGAAINSVARGANHSWSPQQQQLIAKADTLINHKIKDLPYQQQQKALAALKASYDEHSHRPESLNAKLERILSVLK